MTIEERIAVLESEMAELKQKASQPTVKPNWIENIAGSFKDDPEFGEILRRGREIREADKLDNVNGDA